MGIKKLLLILLIGVSVNLGTEPVPQLQPKLVLCEPPPCRGTSCIVRGYRIDSSTQNYDDLGEVIRMVDYIHSFKTYMGVKRIKVVGYANLREYKKDKKIAYKRAERVYELMRYYGLDTEIKLDRIEGREPLEADRGPEPDYFNRRVEVLIIKE